MMSWIEVDEHIFFINLQELNKHIEDGLGKNLADRCSSEVNESMHQSQQEIIGNVGKAGCWLSCLEKATWEDLLPE